MHKAVRNQYVKAEGRKIRYRASAKAYFIPNAILHIVFAIIVLGEIVAAFGTPLRIWMSRIYTMYYCLLCVALAELGITTHSENRKYYKNLNRKGR